MTDHIPDQKTLTPSCIRALLLKQVTSRMDIISYCNHFLHLELKQTNGIVYKGSCPWCGKKEVFFCHKTAGTCICESCETIADFFDIMTTHWKLDVSFALCLLARQIKKAAELRTPGQEGDV
jgi:hypothetical protein